MGETRLRTYPSGRRTYIALYADAGGKLKRVEGFDPVEVPAGARGGEIKAIKKACSEAWRDREREVAREVAEARPLGQALRKGMTFGEYAPLWLRTHDVGANRKKNLTTDINALNKVFAEVPLEQIQPIDIRAYIADLRAAGTGSCTMENRYTTLKAILRTAVVDGLLPRSPFDGGEIKKPRRVAKPRGRVITVEEYARIAEGVEEIAGAEARLLVDVLIGSGLRWGEVSELRAEDLCELGLSLARATADAGAAFSSDGGRYLIKDTKGHEAEVVPLMPELLARLRDHVKTLGLRAGSGQDWRAPRAGEAADEGLGDLLFSRQRMLRSQATAEGDLATHQRRLRVVDMAAAGMAKEDIAAELSISVATVYRDLDLARQGKAKTERLHGVQTNTTDHLDYSWFRKSVWVPAVEKAQIPIRVTMHKLRAAYLTWAVDDGMDPRDVQILARHKQLSTTEKYFGARDRAEVAAQLRAKSRLA